MATLQKTEEMTAPVKLVVIGLGWIGRKHAELIDAHSQCTLVGVGDVDAQHASFAAQINAPFYSDVEELLESEAPDGAIIATPNGCHASVAELCARQKVHVLIEKPLANTLSEARRVVDVAETSGIRVVVGHHRRHSPFIQTARSIVRDGELGSLVGASMLWALMKPMDYFELPWRRQRPGGGPTLINLIHELDSLRFICGEIRQVYAQASSASRNFEVEDSLSLSLLFENGALGSILASDTAPSPWSYEATTGENPHYFHAAENCYHFFGTRGALSLPAMEVWKYAPGVPGGWQHPLERVTRKVIPQDPLESQLKHFCQVVRNEQRSLVDAGDGMRSLAVALAVLESAESQRPVEVSH